MGLSVPFDGFNFFSHGFDFCSHGFDSYDFGFTVLIFSVDGFAGFQEDESWVDQQWVDPFDQLEHLIWEHPVWENLTFHIPSHLTIYIYPYTHDLEREIGRAHV